MRSPSAAENSQPAATRLTRARRDSGSVTAEFAAVVPAVILVLALCLAGLQLSTRRLQVQDAAALVARSVARGVAFDAGILVDGASTRIERRGNLVCAVVAVPGTMLSGILGAVELSASSCAFAGGE